MGEADQVAREAAAMLRRVLNAVERGDRSAGTPRAMALVRRIEGAAVALEAAAGHVMQHAEQGATLDP